MYGRVADTLIYLADHVYHGDVLNTTARIEGKCTELEQKLLVSQALISSLDPEINLSLEKMGEIWLKGKSKTLSLYGVKP